MSLQTGDVTLVLRRAEALYALYGIRTDCVVLNPRHMDKEIRHEVRGVSFRTAGTKEELVPYLSGGAYGAVLVYGELAQRYIPYIRRLAAGRVKILLDIQGALEEQIEYSGKRPVSRQLHEVPRQTGHIPPRRRPVRRAARRFRRNAGPLPPLCREKRGDAPFLQDQMRRQRAGAGGPAPDLAAGGQKTGGAFPTRPSSWFSAAPARRGRRRTKLLSSSSAATGPGRTCFSRSSAVRTARSRKSLRKAFRVTITRLNSCRSKG